MFQKITRKNLAPFLSKYASSEKVLDVGSGGSSYGKYFPNRFTVDIDPKRKPDVIADAQSLPFRDGEFAMVLSTEMLEHVKDPRKAVSEMMRVLKKDGLLILTTRFVYPIHDSPNDYWRYTKYGLQELFREWTIVEIVSETKSFSALGALFQRMSFQGKYRGGKITKFFLLLSAFLLDHLNWLIVEEYGDIGRSSHEENIFSTGLYVVVKK